VSATRTIAVWSMSLDCECPSCKEDVDLLRLDCECPSCKEDVDLLRYPDFWSGRGDMIACENGTERSRNLEVVCPECGHEFVVDCQY